MKGNSLLDFGMQKKKRRDDIGRERIVNVKGLGHPTPASIISLHATFRQRAAITLVLPHRQKAPTSHVSLMEPDTFTFFHTTFSKSQLLHLAIYG